MVTFFLLSQIFFCNLDFRLIWFVWLCRRWTMGFTGCGSTTVLRYHFKSSFFNLSWFFSLINIVCGCIQLGSYLHIVWIVSFSSRLILKSEITCQNRKKDSTFSWRDDSVDFLFFFLIVLQMEWVWNLLNKC